MPKAKFGYMVHADCGSRVLVRVNEKETLSAQCDECDCTDYAPKDSARHAAWSKKIERIAPEKPAAPAKPEPKPAAPPAKSRNPMIPT